MKKILIVCPKPNIEFAVKKHFEDKNQLDGLSFASTEFVTNSIDEMIHLTKSGEQYFIDGEKTDAFVELALNTVEFEDGKYAVSVSPIRARKFDLNVDYVLFVNSGYDNELLSAVEFCERNEIESEKAFLSVIPAFTDSCIEQILDLEHIHLLYDVISDRNY